MLLLVGKKIQNLTGVNDSAVRRLRKGLDGFVKTVVVECDYICKDYRSIYSNFLSKKFTAHNSKCARLHFFSDDGLTVDNVVIESNKCQKAYIGHSVIHPIVHPDEQGCLGRTVIDPFKCGKEENTFYCLSATFTASIRGAKYTVNGYPYISQSGEATVCAHAAVWNVCRYLSQKYHEYREIYPYDVITLMGDDTEGRRVPYRPMRYQNLARILSEFGCHPVVRRVRSNGDQWHKDAKTYFDIYSYVESGFPVLMAFPGHVATAIGHTSRSTLAFEQPDSYGFHSSYALLDQYVVIDDNFFPYQLLGEQTDTLDRNYGLAFRGDPQSNPSKQTIYSAVVPLPEKAFMEADGAREIGGKFFGRKHFKDMLTEVIKRTDGDTNDPIIARLLLTSSNSFKHRKRGSFLRRLDDQAADTLAELPLMLSMPHFIWLMEISPLRLYNKGFVVGELVLDASAGPGDYAILYGRIGNHIAIGNREQVDANAPECFRLYSHNLGERP